ncbi:AGE family epimerase/isomerase [Flavobacterium sp. NRK F10]|uniref:AGE family epimerase/isomerase n=1 Tax=Flavobacterium sp. NRK F10 TaxID=2954931 RepID=UPI0020913809|nr:AGE family epimerase/isomerase [Flavobacterium sp. NRK F10]MCO6176039.1 AGE family epimerase/isomerase [Flavobacterium sp. NRK F10]
MPTPERKQNLKNEVREELNHILNYWKRNTIDTENDGFVGQIDAFEKKVLNAEKGSVLNARILWSFSAAYQITQDPSDLETATKAYHFINSYFFDKEFGGVFWSVAYDGKPSQTKKQIYALAFTIYGLAEYYKITQDQKVLQMAISLFETIEKYSFDPVNKGYLEAFTQEWNPIEDLRLSAKDVNEKKTMNTHLHIVEAYANLFLVWPNELLQTKIIEILETINHYFINTKTGHLKLFFNEEWIEKPDVVSYGHDIEAAWLLLWCARITQNQELIEIFTKHALQMADATFEGIDQDGSLWYELDPQKNNLITEKHWWPQAELLIGMINAWELTQEEKYFTTAEKNWDFIKRFIIDKENGEWIWGIHGDYSKIINDKAGLWKCPYHNSRACIELIDRL